MEIVIISCLQRLTLYFDDGEDAEIANFDLLQFGTNSTEKSIIIPTVFNVLHLEGVLSAKTLWIEPFTDRWTIY